MKQHYIVKMFIIVCISFLSFGCYTVYDCSGCKGSEQKRNPKSATWFSDAIDEYGRNIENTAFGRYWKIDFSNGKALNPITYGLTESENIVNSPRFLAFSGNVGNLTYYLPKDGLLRPIFRTVYDGLEERWHNAIKPFYYDNFGYSFLDKISDSNNPDINQKYNIYPANLYLGIKTKYDCIISTYVSNNTYKQYLDFVVVCINRNKTNGYVFELKKGPLPLYSTEFKLSDLLQSVIGSNLPVGYTAVNCISDILQNNYDIFVVIRNTRNDNISNLYNVDCNFCFRNVIKITDSIFIQ